MIIKNLKNSKKVILGLHGWTGDKTSLEPIIKLFNLPNTKWICLQGPYKVKQNGYSWFAGNDNEGWKYKKSFNKLNKCIKDLIKQDYQHNQIYILGFSQGACLAMEFMIRQPYSLGGIIPIAGFIKYKDRFVKDNNIKSKNTLVLLLHGNKDNIISPKESEIAYKFFKNLDYKTQLYLLPAKHKIPLQSKSIILNQIYNIKINK